MPDDELKQLQCRIADMAEELRGMAEKIEADLPRVARAEAPELLTVLTMLDRSVAAAARTAESAHGLAFA